LVKQSPPQRRQCRSANDLECLEEQDRPHRRKTTLLHTRGGSKEDRRNPSIRTVASTTQVRHDVAPARHAPAGQQQAVHRSATSVVLTLS
jgi:hypothetical protein